MGHGNCCISRIIKEKRMIQAHLNKDTWSWLCEINDSNLDTFQVFFCKIVCDDVSMLPSCSEASRLWSDILFSSSQWVN